MSEKDSSQKPKDDKWQTSYSLIERVRNPDDNESWTEFRQHYYHYIFYLLKQVGLNAQESEIVTQDVIVKLWKELPKFVYNRDRGKFRQWLAVVVRNVATDYFRKNNKHRQYIDDQDDDTLNRIQDNLAEDELNRLIIEEWDVYISNLAWKSIENRFEKNMQEVFLLHIDGVSPKEIAEKCKIKESNVYVYIHRIKNHLKSEIERFNKELL